MLLKKLIFFLRNNRLKNIVLPQKGFSLLELIFSVAAMGFFALLVQSMLIIGHSFTESQHNLFESAQISRMIKQHMCMRNVSFKNINVKSKLSYSKTEDPETKTDADGTDYTVYTREYKRLDDSSSSSFPLLGIDVAGAYDGSEPECNRDCEKIIEETEKGKGSPGSPLFGEPTSYYRVYQDSHTVSALTLDLNTSSTELLSGYIFASRCVKNDSDYTYSHGGQMLSTFNPEAIKKSAVYILENMRRPFYFPSTDTDGEDTVKCCRVGGGRKITSTSSNCKKIGTTWVPRIYVMHIGKGEDSLSHGGSFSVEMQGIQEFPEMQDMNTIWSAGFVMSMSEIQIFSRSAFQLDTMLLRNTCFTSATTIQQCPDMSFGVDISKEEYKGFIRTNVGSCAGFSSGVDTTSLIRF